MSRTVIATAIFATSALFASTIVVAAPPGVPDDVGKKVFQFNLIGYPAGKTYDGNCGNGGRIFVNRDDSHAHIRITDDNDGWWVSDCDATGGSYGEFHSDDVGSFVVYARILGKIGGEISVCADTVTDHNGDHLCEIGTFSMKRETGTSQFGIKASKFFDASLEDIIWSLDVNKDFRLAQFRVYEAP